MSFRKEIYTAKYNINLLWLLNTMLFLLVLHFSIISSDEVNQNLRHCGKYGFRCVNKTTYQVCAREETNENENNVNEVYNNKDNILATGDCSDETMCNENYAFYCLPFQETTLVNNNVFPTAHPTVRLVEDRPIHKKHHNMHEKKLRTKCHKGACIHAKSYNRQDYWQRNQNLYDKSNHHMPLIKIEKVKMYEDDTGTKWITNKDQTVSQNPNPNLEVTESTQEQLHTSPKENERLEYNLEDEIKKALNITEGIKSDGEEDANKTDNKWKTADINDENSNNKPYNEDKEIKSDDALKNADKYRKHKSHRIHNKQHKVENWAEIDDMKEVLGEKQLSASHTTKDNNQKVQTKDSDERQSKNKNVNDGHQKHKAEPRKNHSKERIEESAIKTQHWYSALSKHPILNQVIKGTQDSTTDQSMYVVVSSKRVENEFEESTLSNENIKKAQKETSTTRDTINPTNIKMNFDITMPSNVSAMDKEQFMNSLYTNIIGVLRGNNATFNSANLHDTNNQMRLNNGKGKDATFTSSTLNLPSTTPSNSFTVSSHSSSFHQSFPVSGISENDMVKVLQVLFTKKPTTSNATTEYPCKSIGIFPDASNNTRFYVCVSSKEGNRIVPISAVCLDNKIFDPVIGDCVNSQGRRRVRPEITRFIPKKCKKKHEKYANTRDKSSYYECDKDTKGNLHMFKKHCKYSHLFDNNSKICRPKCKLIKRKHTNTSILKRTPHSDSTPIS